MHNHPLNLLLRFLLELIILFAIGRWAYFSYEGMLKYLMMIVLPAGGAAAWGIFRVPADHGKGVIAIRGYIRLIMEVIFFLSGWYCLNESGMKTTAAWFAILSIIHYIISYKRIILLLKN